MNMQDQTRKAFGHYASRAHARATAGNLAKSLVGSDLKAGSELNPLLIKRGDDLELPGYVTPPMADERLKKQLDDLESPGYVTPHVVDDSSLTDDQLAEITANIDDAVERYRKHSVNGSVFGESIARVAVDKDFLGDVSSIDHQMAMDYDGDTLPDEKSYRRLAKRARGYEAGNRTDDYVQPPKADDYVQPPKDVSFTDALVRLNDDQFNQAADDVRSLMSSPDVIIARPDVAKELGSVRVNDFGDVAKVVSTDDIGYDHDGDTLPDEKSYSRLAKRARGYEAGSLTNDYVTPPKYDDYVQSPKADDYVQPPKYDNYVQPPTVPEFDASQFEMANDEVTKSIDDVPMAIDEGQFDMTPAKGLQQ